jgi:hypothetical protein
VPSDVVPAVVEVVDPGDAVVDVVLEEVVCCADPSMAGESSPLHAGTRSTNGSRNQSRRRIASTLSPAFALRP